MARESVGSGEHTPDPAIMLELLSAVERDSNLSQRSLSRELGVALGLANAYVRRCVRKGLIKVRQAPLNRYGYYLTPKGFTEKARLTAEYLSMSLNFFRDARHQCTSLLRDDAQQSLRRCVLVGDGDLAEIAVLSAGDANVEILCVVDGVSSRDRCAGRPVVSTLQAAADLAEKRGGIELYMITDVQTPQTTYEAVALAVTEADVQECRVLVPELLRVIRRAVDNANGQSSS